ncbi:hypothetical protein [Clavibacter michiganensis]|uniref:hypothetical protein n=1 Tax=Clavibacter michiganensis TaxID=28447 RepID=UPI0011B0C44B|nr:hypothetical protein [Clavibacter michiganensis]
MPSYNRDPRMSQHKNSIVGNNETPQTTLSRRVEPGNVATKAPRLAISVLPAVALGGFLALSWTAGLIYHAVAEINDVDPFGRIWSAFQPLSSLPLLLTVLAAVAVGSLFPSRGVRLQRLAEARVHTRQMGSRLWLASGIAILTVLVVVKGPYLYVADRYLQFTFDGAAASIANLLSPLGFLIAGVVSARKRKVGRLLLVLFLLVMFAYGTRLMGVGPILYAAGAIFAGRRLSWKKLLSAGIASVVLLPIALHSRGLSSHGLVPYMQEVFRHPISIYTGGLIEMLGNVGFTAPISAFSASTRPIPWAALAASLDPSFADSGEWQRWGPQLRAHLYIPFSAIGEWGNAGLMPLFFAALTWTVIVRICVQITAKDRGVIGDSLLVATLGLSGLAALYVGQYNTRSVNRILTLIVAVAAVAAVRRAYASLVRTKSLPVVGSPLGMRHGAR